MAIPFSYNLRNLRERLTTTIMTALGIGLTVAVLLGILALVDGLTNALAVTGHPNHVVIMRQGSTAELVSGVQQEKFNIIKFYDEVAKLDGEPMASHEVVSVASLPLRGGDPDETGGNVNVRGMSPIGLEMRDDLELVEGRWFEPGKREMVVGEGAHAIRAGTDIGDLVPYGRGDWEVVGVFRAGRSAYNSEFWVDGNLATADLGRGSTRSSVLVRTVDEAAALSLIERVKSDQRVALEGKLETDYYAEQMSSAGPVKALGVFVAAIMAIGSCFAAMNTMYTARVAARQGDRHAAVARLLALERDDQLRARILTHRIVGRRRRRADGPAAARPAEPHRKPVDVLRDDVFFPGDAREHRAGPRVRRRDGALGRVIAGSHGGAPIDPRLAEGSVSAG